MIILKMAQQYADCLSTTTFSDKKEEDINEFILWYDAEGDTLNWDQYTKVRRLNLALRGDALSAWLLYRKTTTACTWADVKKELRQLFRKYGEQIEKEVITIQFKEEDGFSGFKNFVAKFKLRVLDHINPEMAEDEMVIEIIRQLPPKVKEFFTKGELKNMRDLEDYYHLWAECQGMVHYKVSRIEENVNRRVAKFTQEVRKVNWLNGEELSESLKKESDWVKRMGLNNL